MGKRKLKQQRVDDVYEAEELVAEEENQPGRKFDSVDNFQYELPEDFQDEEIDEDTAFTPEDNKLYAHIFQRGDQASSEDEQDLEGQKPELTRDDFSEDDSEADRLFGVPTRQKASPESSDKGASDVDELFTGFSTDGQEGESTQTDAEEETSEQIAKAVSDALGPLRRKRKRKDLQVQDEAAPESEFNLPPSGDGGEEVTLADLINALGPPKGKLTKAQKQLSQLARSSEAVAAPLPRPIKARKERQAGYEATSKDIKKWIPIVRVNREAPTLVFTPAQNDVPRKSSTAALAESFQPKNGMEAEVAALLKAAGVQSEEALEEAEEALALKAISAEEMARRRNELAKMRSLMFRHEAKAQRLAKIKSKDYHRRINKASRRKAEKAGLMDDKDFIRLEAEKAEYERARERLTLKHKNTSQWARRALKRGVNLKNDGTREAIAEQLRLGEELRRRVDRMDPVSGSDTEASHSTGSSDAEGSESDGASPSRSSRKASAKTRAAAAAILEEHAEEADVSKSLFSLPFMKRAQEKRRKAAESEALRALEELEGVAEESDVIGGRKNFGLQGGIQANIAPPDFEVEDNSGSDENEDAEAKLARLRAAAETAEVQNDASLAQPLDAADTREEGQLGARKTRNQGRQGKQQAGTQAGLLAKPKVIVSGVAELERPTAETSGTLPEEESAFGKAGNPSILQRVAAQQRSIQARSNLLSEAAEGRLEGRGSVAKRPSGEASVTVGPSAAGVADAQEAADHEVQNSGSSEGVEAYPRAPKPSITITEAAVVDGRASDDEKDANTGVKMAQQELIAQAFAGDDVAAAFEEGKEAEIQAELPKVEGPSLMPGWGTWASQQREPRWMVEARKKAEQEKEAARANRKDAKLKNVILSERWDKKAAKFSTPNLPFPFTSKEILEGTMRHPLGSDFNTEASHRAMTRPAVIKSAGTIIQPLKFSPGVAQEKRAVHRASQYNRQAVQRIAGGVSQPMKKRSKPKAARAS